MSYFECRLNRHLWRSKKVVQLVQIWGREVIGQNPKEQQVFLMKLSLKYSIFSHYSEGCIDLIYTKVFLRKTTGKIVTLCCPRS